jgi:hypothetical protein
MTFYNFSSTTKTTRMKPILLQCLSLVAVHFIEEEEKQMMSRQTCEEEHAGQIPATPASNVFCVQNRIEWDLHVTHLMEEGPSVFVQIYRMQYASFVQLCGLIKP